MESRGDTTLNLFRYSRCPVTGAPLTVESQFDTWQFMSQVVPSQVIALTDKLFPWAKDQRENDHKNALSAEHAYSVAAILDMVEQLPQELITLDADDLANFVSSIATLRTLIQKWQTRDFSFERIPGLRPVSPITLIRRALAKCPDEFPSTGTSELSFIADPGLRQSLRLDISATNSALRNGEWKATTVLSGSVVEALLLWALLSVDPIDIAAAATGLKLKVKPTLEEWVLYEYIEIARELKLIGAKTAMQCQLAKDYRNLIHPGRAQRLGQVCNRGTALSAVAAVEHVIGDLAR